MCSLHAALGLGPWELLNQGPYPYKLSVTSGEVTLKSGLSTYPCINSKEGCYHHGRATLYMFYMLLTSPSCVPSTVKVGNAKMHKREIPFA